MSLVAVEEHDAFEVVMGADGSSRVVITCEHASDRLPEPWEWTESDQRLVGTHWNIDLGAGEFSREMAAKLGAVAVMARFTRLLIDPNRDLGSPTLFRTWADGGLVHLNRYVPREEAERRIEAYYKPFHRAADRFVGGMTDATLVLSMHSFTPVYEGVPRQLEVGVLFDDNKPLAEALNEALCDEGYDSRLNEPWSGLNGLMYSAQRHARAHEKNSLEIEMRQDLSSDPAWRAEFGAALTRALGAIGVL